MKCKTLFLLSLSMAMCGVVRSQTVDTLSHKTTQRIAPVVVTGTRQASDLSQLPMSVSVVDRKSLDESHQVSLLPVLNDQIPGLFITQRGVMGYGVANGAAGGMSMRGVGGSPTTGMLVLLDGHPQYMGLMGHPIPDAYQTMLAEKVEVVRGPASVVYGSNAMGGVIHILTRKMTQDGVETDLTAGYGSYNTLQSEASNRIKKGRFSSVLSASYQRTDGHRPDMGFDQGGGMVKLGYELSSVWRIIADVAVTHFNAENPGAITKPIMENTFDITRGETSLRIENKYQKTSGSFSIFYNWGRHKIDDGYFSGQEPPASQFNSRDYMAGISFFQNLSLFGKNKITVGFDFQSFGGRAWNRFYAGDHDDKTIADKKQYEVAAYIDLNQYVWRWMSLNLGLRLDHHTHVGSEWIPQAGLAFMLSPTTQLKAMVGKGFRFPTIREMYLFPPQNPDLKPETLINYELSFRQRLFQGRFDYGVNVFYMDGDHIIQVVPVDGRPQNVNTGKIKNWGIEADLDWIMGEHWSLLVNYSFLDMKYPVLASPKHKLYGGIRFRSARWTWTSGVRYVGGLYTSLKTASKEQFVLWNVDAEFRPCRWMTLYVRGENLLGQHYEINAGYPMPKATALGGIKLHF